MSRKDLKARTEQPLRKDRGAALAFPAVRHVCSEKGMALVLTLLILVLITALVTEFSYGVFTTTSALYNWRDSQRLSFIAKSGISLAMQLTTQVPPAAQNQVYQYLGKDLPVDNIVDGFKGTLIVRADDENGKFNLNSLFMQGGKSLNEPAYYIFRRLLKNLGLDQSIADSVTAWINSNPSLSDSAARAKKGFMDSVDELLLIKGIDEKTYQKLSPYVTVYGISSLYDSNIDINTASIPVIMSLADTISTDEANAIVQQRVLKPITQSTIADFSGFKGVSSIGYTLPTNLRITSVAEENKIRRIVETVVNIGSRTVKYWREM